MSDIDFSRHLNALMLIKIQKCFVYTLHEVYVNDHGHLHQYIDVINNGWHHLYVNIHQRQIVTNFCSSLSITHKCCQTHNIVYMQSAADEGVSARLTRFVYYLYLLE